MLIWAHNIKGLCLTSLLVQPFIQMFEMFLESITLNILKCSLWSHLHICRILEAASLQLGLQVCKELTPHYVRSGKSGGQGNTPQLCMQSSCCTGCDQYTRAFLLSPLTHVLRHFCDRCTSTSLCVSSVTVMHSVPFKVSQHSNYNGVSDRCRLSMW